MTFTEPSAIGRDQVLDLLYAAKERYRAADVTLRLRLENTFARPALERWAGKDPRRQRDVQRLTRWSGRDDVSERGIRLQVRPPDHFRFSESSSGKIHFEVFVSPKGWWSHWPSTMEAVEHTKRDLVDGVPSVIWAQAPAIADVLDPAVLIPWLQMRIAGTDVVAGRQGILVSGRFRKEPELLESPHLLLRGAEDHRLLFDREKGMPLRYDARIGAQETRAMEVMAVAFDTVPGDETFEFHPPPGVRLVTE